MPAALLLLLVLFQLKHFLADYPLQTAYMLGKFGPQGWVKPLALHAFVHAMFTDVLIGGYLVLTRPERPLLWALGTACALGTLDFAVHFTMDRIKASPQLLGRYKALSGKEWMRAKKVVESPGSDIARLFAEGDLRGNTRFWWSLGLDQMVHHLTDIAVIAIAVTR
jgi:hypothetical protein